MAFCATATVRTGTDSNNLFVSIAQKAISTGNPNMRSDAELSLDLTADTAARCTLPDLIKQCAFGSCMESSPGPIVLTLSFSQLYASVLPSQWGITWLKSVTRVTRVTLYPLDPLILE